MKFEIHIDGASGKKVRMVELEPQDDGYRVLLDGQAIEADAVQVSSSVISILINGQSYEIHATPLVDGQLKLQCGPHEFTANVMDPRAWRGRKHGGIEAEGRQQIIALMPGKVVRLLVAVGDNVEAGQGLLVVEAMKMQNEIRSPKNGKVERLHAKEGQNVNAGDVLAWVD
jgi:biotin carboxyl carrier protein